MSVEEARRHLWNTLMDFEDCVRDDLDRLILEVQAECACENGDPFPSCPCKTCTARMKLKEPADASLA